ncbi:hypothetical protein AB0M45_08240 [Nocardia sp. NPDC051787]|uniref:hypothetical protein n=1 Tax=Nocardia sp. NPDC051787 TaxID=3155415 RepID=UPI0034351745
MHGTTSRFSIPVAAVAVVAAIGAGPVAAAPTPVAKPVCDFWTTFTKPTLLHPVISADATAVCDKPPERHTLELSLDHVNAGSWVRWALTVDSGIPTRSGRSYKVSAECEAGDWRITVHVYGSIQGRPFDFTEIGDTRTITSSECPRG